MAINRARNCVMVAPHGDSTVDFVVNYRKRKAMVNIYQNFVKISSCELSNDLAFNLQVNLTSEGWSVVLDSTSNS